MTLSRVVRTDLETVLKMHCVDLSDEIKAALVEWALRVRTVDYGRAPAGFLDDRPSQTQARRSPAPPWAHPAVRLVRELHGRQVETVMFEACIDALGDAPDAERAKRTAEAWARLGRARSEPYGWLQHYKAGTLPAREDRQHATRQQRSSPTGDAGQPLAAQSRGLLARRANGD